MDVGWALASFLDFRYWGVPLPVAPRFLGPVFAPHIIPFPHFRNNQSQGSCQRSLWGLQVCVCVCVCVHACICISIVPAAFAPYSQMTPFLHSKCLLSTYYVLELLKHN